MQNQNQTLDSETSQTMDTRRTKQKESKYTMLSFNMPQKIRYWPPKAQSNMDPDFKTGLFNKFQYQIHAKPNPN